MFCARVCVFSAAYFILYSNLILRCFFLLPHASSFFSSHSSIRCSQGIRGNGGTKTIESLDYEIAEHSVYRAEQAKRAPWHKYRYLILKWVLALIVGLGTATTAFLINLAVENVAGLKFSWTSKAMDHTYAGGYFLYTFFNVFLVFSSAYVVTYFAPAAAGSGIPEVKSYLNGIDLPGILLLRTLLGKVFGSVGSVAGGLAVGKEGPLVHTGSCIAALLSQGGSNKFKLNPKWFREFNNDRDRRDLVTCGACAGVAAAFRAPVGGVLFAIEEAASFWRPQLTWRTFFTTAIVSVTIRALMNSCKGEEDCGFFGGGGFIIFNTNEGGQSQYWLYELLPVSILGVLGGLLGASFNYINGKLTRFRIKYLYRNHQSDRRYVKVLEAMLVAFITSTFQFCLPLAFSCKSCDPEISSCPRPKGLHYGNFVRFTCSGDNQYNDLATIFFNTQDDAIRNLFSSEMDQEYSPAALMTFFCFFFLLAVITYGISVPSGLFVPSILCGAAYGRLVGMLMTSITGNIEIKEGTYALLGAASFIGGAMRMTVSMCVILLELTNNLSLLPLIMLVLLVSKATADVTGILPIYDLHIHIKKVPLLEASAERYFRHLTASDAKSNKCVSFARVEKVGFIVDVLKSCNHNGFPVVDIHATDSNGQEQSSLLGVVLRNHLLVVLKKKLSFMNDPNDVIAPLVAFQYDSTEFMKPISSKGMKLSEIGLTDEELEMYIDLSQFVNTSSYTVQEDMSLAKVHQLFRGLGLRHLCIVPKPNEILGIITRKDLLPHHIEEHYPEVKHISRSTSYANLSKSPSFGSFSKRKELGDALIPGRTDLSAEF